MTIVENAYIKQHLQITFGYLGVAICAMLAGGVADGTLGLHLYLLIYFQLQSECYNDKKSIWRAQTSAK